MKDGHELLPTSDATKDYFVSISGSVSSVISWELAWLGSLHIGLMLFMTPTTRACDRPSCYDAKFWETIFIASLSNSQRPVRRLPQLCSSDT